MADKIKTGSIFTEEGTLLSESLRFDSEPYANGLRLVKDLDGCGLERKIREAGWSSCYTAGNVKASVLGSDQEEPKRRALERIVTKLKSDGVNFNFLQITQVAAKRFLGLPYMTLSAHYRHFQESMFLFHAKRVAEWDREKLAAGST
jgi:hypothetical protein